MRKFLKNKTMNNKINFKIMTSNKLYNNSNNNNYNNMKHLVI